ncbi:MAG: glutamate--tRNA ligase [Acidimicrobiia bacterium]
MSEPVRVRFSPAPTGFLHVGGARTALFNWLFARHHAGGVFVLRIEDTDVARSRDEWTAGICETLRWLGLDWDEGPHLQSERAEAYQAAAQRLLDDGRAYRCYCTEDEIAARAAASGRHSGSGYDGHCRDLSDEQRKHLAAEGRPSTVRFRTPDEGASTFVDIVRGEVSVDWATVGDFAIVRSTGATLFFLANAVDDIDMGITHVIRGEDLLDSTHRVLALRAALGVGDRPRFAHLPMIVGADRAKLSKRHGAVALEDFAARGYLPEALRNYLALLGFSPEDGREVMPTADLAAAFDLARVNRSAAFFDYDKLNWMNGEYIRALSPVDLAGRALPYARERYGDRLDPDVFARAMGIAQERLTTLAGGADATGFLFVDEDEFSVAADSVERLRATEGAGEILDAVAAHLETCEWTPEGVDLRPVLDRMGIKPRKALPTVYAAVEGAHAGLPLFDSIVLLGRDRALRRVRSAQALVAS